MSAIRQSYLFLKKHRRQTGWLAASFLLITFYQNCEGTFTTQGDEASKSEKSDSAISGQSGTPGTPGTSQPPTGGAMPPSTQPSAQPPPMPTGTAPTISPEEAARLEAARITACKALMGKPSFATTTDQSFTLTSGAGDGSGDIPSPTLTMGVDRAVSPTPDPKDKSKTLEETLPCSFTTDVTCSLVTGDPTKPAELSKAIDDGGKDASVSATTPAAKEAILAGAFRLNGGSCTGQVDKVKKSRDIKLASLRTNNTGTIYRCVQGSIWVKMTAVTQINNQNKSLTSDPVYMKVSLNDNCWSETRLVPGPDALPSKAHFGGAVAIDGEWAASVATEDSPSATLAAGSFSLFKKVAGQWTFTQKIILDGASAGDRLTAISIKGSKLAVSSSLRAGTGLVAIYSLNSGTGLWESTQIITPPDVQAGQAFGASLALTENSLAVGAPKFSVGGIDAHDLSGQVYIFTCGLTSCTYSYPLNVNQPYRGFGSSVAISGNTLAVGAPQAITRESDGKGFVNLYDLSSKMLTRTIAPQDGDLGMRFGDSVALDGTRLAVGAPFRTNTVPATPLESSGGVYYYADTGLSTLTRLLIGAAPGGNLGRSVALSSGGLFAGCPFCAAGGGAVFYHKGTSLEAGAVADFTIFNLNRTTGDRYGISLKVSGADLIVGAFDKSDPNFNGGATFIHSIK